MITLLTKLRAIERELSAIRGDFEFFGLMLRAGSPGKWDLVVAAPWLDPEKRRSTKLIDDELRKHLNVYDKIHLSRIVVLDPQGPMLEALMTRFSVLHGLEETREESFLDLDFERIYVITAGRTGITQTSQVS